MKTIEKLELKHLAGYLPYELKMKVAANPEPTHTLCSLVCNNSCFVSELGLKQWIRIYKPILHPLSDLIKEININGKRFIPEDKINNELLYSTGKLNCEHGVVSLQFHEGISNKLIAIAGEVVDECPLGICNNLFKWHFDIYGLIESGLAIDINTLK